MQIQGAAMRICSLIDELIDAGCEVIDAVVRGDGSVVRIAQPPDGVFDSFGFVPPPPGSVPVPVVCSTQRDGARIEWVEVRR